MHRFIDTELYPLDLSLVNEYLSYPLVPLEQALESIIPRIDQLNEFIEIAKAKCHFPSEHNLTIDESAAIFLYTMEWNNNCLYQIIQRDFHSKDRSISKSWFSYLKLFDSAVRKLPNSRINVWGGVHKDLSKKLKKDDKFIWWNIISCSSSDNIIKDILEPNSTLCFIEALNGKDISDYSHSPNQNEIILCPGTCLHVVNDVQDKTSSSVLCLREGDQCVLSSMLSYTDNGVVNSIPSKWCKSRVFSLMPHLIVLITALLLIIIIDKSLSTFVSSTIIKVLIKPLFQAIFPSKNEINLSTSLEKPSIFHINVDTLGNRYEGEWKDGKKHGKGKMDFANGHKYIGKWVDGMMTGEGVFIWSNGDKYEGSMKEGQRHGRGSYIFVNGDNYTGNWIEDKKAGYGIASLAMGRYEGQFKNDKMHGKGSFYFVNGDKYVGDWVDDKQEGEGIFTWSYGDRFEGEFKGGKQHGKGSYYFVKGNKFKGEWIDGERVIDHGALTWGDNDPHSDNFKNDKEYEKQ